MPQNEEDKAFTVKDRRRFDASGNPREGRSAESPSGAKEPSPSRAQPSAPKEPSPSRAQPSAPRSPAADSAGRGAASPRSAAPPSDEAGAEGAGGIDFAEFILSLATNAVVHLGGDPRDGRIPGRVNLPLAAQHIDIIAMLGQKTRGNLTPDEAELIDSLLYDLRMKYVSVAQSEARGR